MDSFTDPLGMKGWVGHVGWPTADVWPTNLSSVQLAVRRRTGKVRRSKTSILALCYAAISAIGSQKISCLCLLGLSLVCPFIPLTATSSSLDSHFGSGFNANYCSSPIRRNSVLEKLRVGRLAVIQKICCRAFNWFKSCRSFRSWKLFLFLP